MNVCRLFSRLIYVNAAAKTPKNWKSLREREGRLSEVIVRFIIGGVLVSLFASLGDLFKPKSFAGLFGAAPSVALSTLGLAILNQGEQYAATEARSMAVGAVAFFIYARCVAWFLMRLKLHALTAAILLLPLWFTTAFGVYLAIRIWQ